MRIQITRADGADHSGLFGADGQEIPLGTEFDVNEEPVAWAGRYTVLTKGGEGKARVTNPKEVDPERAALEALDVDELKALATDEGADLKGATAKGDMISQILAHRKAVQKGAKL